MAQRFPGMSDPLFNSREHAGKLAEAEMVEMMARSQAKCLQNAVRRFSQWWDKWCPTAGDRRLGRIIIELSKGNKQ